MSESSMSLNESWGRGQGQVGEQLDLMESPVDVLLDYMRYHSRLLYIEAINSLSDRYGNFWRFKKDVDDLCLDRSFSTGGSNFQS